MYQPSPESAFIEYEAFKEDHEPNVLEAQSQNALLALLKERPLYAEDAPIAQFVADRVRFLCGDEYKMPQIYVRDSPEANAAACGNAIVVDRGLIDLMDYVEEVDGVLAHELIHNVEGHIHQEPRATIQEQLGTVRVQETRADVRGMLLQDERGGNPRGTISMLEKLAAAQEEQWNGKRRIWDESPTHGITRERAVTLEQIAWLFDMRNLSQADMTPLPIDSAQYGVVEKTSPATNDVRRIQASLNRRAAFLVKHDALDEGKRTELLAEQRRAIAMADPTLAHDEIGRLSALSFSRYDSTFQVPVELEAAKQMLRDMEHPALLAVQGSFPLGHKIHLHETWFRQAVAAEASLDELRTIAQTYKEINVDHADAILSEVLVTALLANINDESRRHAITTLIAESDTAMAFMMHPPGSVVRAAGIDLELIEGHPHIRASLKQIATARYEKALAQPTTVEFLRVLCRSWGGDIEHLLKRIKVYDVRSEIPNLLEDQDETYFFDGIISTMEFSKWYTTVDPDAFSKWRESFSENDSNPLERVAEDDDGNVIIPKSIRVMPDKVLQRLFYSCVQDKPTDIASQLMAAEGLDDDERVAIAHLWIAFSRLSAYSQQDALDELPLLFAVKSPDFLRQADDFVNEAALEAFGRERGSHELDVDSDNTDVDETFDSKIIGTAVHAILQRIHAALESVSDSSDNQLRRTELMAALTRESEKARGYLTLGAFEALAWDGDVQPLVSLLNNGVPTRITATLFANEDLSRYARTMWEGAVNALLNRPDALDDEHCLRALVALGVSAENVEVNLHVSSQALMRLVEARSFNEGMELLFNELNHLPGYVKDQAVGVLIEKKAQSLEDFTRLEAAMLDHLDNFVQTHADVLGVGSVIETNIIEAYKEMANEERERGLMKDHVHGLESAKLMQALLSSAQSDEAIKKYVFERWWTSHRFHPVLQDYFKVEDVLIWRHPGKEKRRDAWIKELPKIGDYMPLAEVINKLYLSDDRLRFMAVRKLMLGDDGVLKQDTGRSALVDGFMNSWLKNEPGSAADGLLRNLLSSFLSSASAERVYQYVGPILQDLILKPPKEHSPNRDIAVAKAQEVVGDLVERKRLAEDTLNGSEVPIVRNKIYYLIHGQTSKAAIEAAQAPNQTNERLMALFHIERSDDFEQISPVELALMTGKKAGAVGVRTLQLAGQYYDIPEDERHKFNEVYDSMKGQTRLQAFKVLMREAEGSPLAEALVSNIAEFGERLGGGSLMTVYRTRMKDGSRRVTGVRNPNAEYHVAQITDVLQKALETSLLSDPENKDLQMAQSLIDDVGAWIGNELNDTAFVRKDPVFRQENDTKVGTGFRKGRSRYDLHVPQAYDTGTPWIRHEDYVPGVNLANLTVVEDEPTDLSAQKMSRADFQDVTSLLVRNTLHQIRHGRFAHSDAHGGNFRVTDDNMQVAVFDRYNLIEMTPEIRTTLEQVIVNLASGDRQTAVASVIRGTMPAADDAQVRQLASDIAAGLQDEEDISQGLASTLIALKKAGIRVPVNLSLLLRNMFSMTQLSLKAGFDDVVGAFMHTASEEEVADLLDSFGAAK